MRKREESQRAGRQPQFQQRAGGMTVEQAGQPKIEKIKAGMGK
jgi:hypothetical protein